MRIRKIGAFLAAVIVVSALISVSAFADSILKLKGRAIVVDLAECLDTADEEEIVRYAQKFADKSGFNVVILISDDVGADKSDRGVVDYADVYYETFCGKDTDGLLLLINNDTKYDYISTSGACINYYSDYRIERMFDMFFDCIKSGDYKNAALNFVDSADYYYGLGKDNNQIEVWGKEVEPEQIVITLLFLLVVAALIGLIIFGVNHKKYKLAKPVNQWYVVKGSLLFSQATDTFLGNVTTRIYSPQSTGGGSGGGGGSHHSSTHHSSGGGRHGGGGRHR